MEMGKLSADAAAQIPELKTRVGRLKVALDDTDDRPPVAKLLEIDADKSQTELKEKSKQLQAAKLLT